MPTPSAAIFVTRAESVLWHCGERGEKTQPALQNIIAEPVCPPALQLERGDTIGKCWDRREKMRGRPPSALRRLTDRIQHLGLPNPRIPRSPVACPRPWPSKRSCGRPDLWEGSGSRRVRAAISAVTGLRMTRGLAHERFHAPCDQDALVMRQPRDRPSRDDRDRDPVPCRALRMASSARLDTRFGAHAIHRRA